jgi:spore maturation protein CgeB
LTGRLKFRIFAHSWTSDWNHGNAHFLRGLASELGRMGHEVLCYEEENSWSRTNLLQEEPAIAQTVLQQFRQAFPDLDVRFYRLDDSVTAFLHDELREADIVLIHEWNPPALVNAILQLKKQYDFVALFHDTHHRAYTNPKEILQMDLGSCDGVLAFGEAIRRIYQDAFGIKRVWTFHEAADIRHFRPVATQKNTDVVWVGNWGDEERTRELEEFLISPLAGLNARAAVHGVRYPQHAKTRLQDAGIDFRGYLPNLQAPEIYAQTLLTLHVPRRFYANGLSGIPTIRVFEALACGIPLVCAPWTDTEGLFTANEDYLVVPDGEAMRSEIKRLIGDDKARAQMANRGLRTIQKRHTCAHRAEQLLEISEDLAK